MLKSDKARLFKKSKYQNDHKMRVLNCSEIIDCSLVSEPLGWYIYITVGMPVHMLVRLFVQIFPDNPS